MEHNTELNYMINSLFRIEKWHLICAEETRV